MKEIHYFTCIVGLPLFLRRAEQSDVRFATEWPQPGRHCGLETGQLHKLDPLRQRCPGQERASCNGVEGTDPHRRNHVEQRSRIRPSFADLDSNATTLSQDITPRPATVHDHLLVAQDTASSSGRQ